MKKFILCVLFTFAVLVCANSVSVNVPTKYVHTECTIATKQCKAITKKGTRCSQNAQPGSKYYWQHSK